MKITPLEIRQKSFEKVFRGFDAAEVNAFLQSLAQEWERMVEDYKEQRYKLELAEKEVSKLRDVEASLFKTLKTAEDTGNSLVEQANKKSELIVREAELKAETILNDARAKARDMVQLSEERSEQVIQAMEKRVKQLEQAYRILESYRDNLLSDLLVLANNTLERVEHAEAKLKKNDLNSLLDRAEEVSREIRQERPRLNWKPEEAQPLSSATEDEEADVPAGEDKSGSSEGSFFDEIK
jgi:cell division initiation protein